MKKIATLLLVSSFILMLSGCNSIWEKETDEHDVNILAEKLTNLYEWKSAEISFRYPDTENVLDASGKKADILYINKSKKIPGGDTVGIWTTLYFFKAATLEEIMTEQSTELESSVSEEQIGDKTFTKVIFYQESGESLVTYYLLETEKGVFEIKVGQNEEALTQMILETLEV